MPPGGAPVLVVYGVGNAGTEKVARLQSTVVVVLEEAAMEGVGTRLHHYVDGCGAGPSQLRIVGGSADIDCRDGVGRENDGCQIVVLLDVVVESLNHEIIQPVQPVDR